MPPGMPTQGGPAALTDGYATAITTGAVIFAVTAIAGALVLPGRLNPPPDNEEATPGPLDAD